MRLRFLLLAILVGSSCLHSEPFERLSYRVFDAEYSQSLKLVVMASKDPPALHLYDPVLRSDQTVALSADPTCLALSLDGRFAAVGHDYLVSYVDLNTASVVSTYSVTTRVVEIVLADNGWIYAYGGPDIEINIATGATRIGRNDWGTSAQQRRGTPYVYEVEGNNLRRFEISSGVMSPGYYAPYWYPEDHPFCSRLWLSDDGRRIFTGCGHTFRASSSIDQDMQYVGSLSRLVEIQSLSDSSAAHHALVIPTGKRLADDRVQLYHDAYLEYRGAMPFPPFLVDGKRYPAHGRFVFFDASGRYFVSILQADESAGLQEDFAVFATLFDPNAFIGASGPTPPPLPSQSFPTFDHTVQDAEYDTALDRIVYVSSDPNTLHILDPESGADRVVSLPDSPNSVSIAPAGDRAAVGHDGALVEHDGYVTHEDGSVSLVDLQTASLVANYPAGREVLDTVLTSDWVYAFPRVEGAEVLRGIELATGKLERRASNGVDGNAHAKLDATGTKLYVANYGGSLTAYDISQHPARYVQTVFPNPGVGYLWLSEDGRRIFTLFGGVLGTSPDAQTDMRVEGQLEDLPISRPGQAFIRHVSDSTKAGTIAAIPGIGGAGYGFSGFGEARVELFDSASLSFERFLDLPDFVLGAESYPARGSFVFFNRAGTRLYVIVEADSASGLSDGFGLVSFDLR